MYRLFSYNKNQKKKTLLCVKQMGAISSTENDNRENITVEPETEGGYIAKVLLKVIHGKPYIQMSVRDMELCSVDNHQMPFASRVVENSYDRVVRDISSKYHTAHSDEVQQQQGAIPLCQRRVWWMLDTGASICVVASEACPRNARAQTVKTNRTNQYHVGSLEGLCLIDGVCVSNVQTACMNDLADNITGGDIPAHEFGGIVGQAFLNHFTFIMDFRNRWCYFYPKNTNITETSFYNNYVHRNSAGQVYVMNCDNSGSYSAGYSVVAIALANSWNSIDRIPRMTIDTGSDMSSIRRQVLLRHGETEDSIQQKYNKHRKTILADTEMNILVDEVAHFDFYDVFQHNNNLKRLPLYTPNESGANWPSNGTDGLIGMDLLQQYSAFGFCPKQKQCVAFM